MLRWERTRGAVAAVVTAVAIVMGGTAVRPASAQTTVVLNPDGGQGADDGIRIVLYEGTNQIQRGGEYQVYDYDDLEAYTGFVLDVREPGGVDIVCRSIFGSSSADSACPSTEYVDTEFTVTDWTVDTVEALPQPDADTWAGRQILTSTTPTNTYTLIYTMTYTRPNPYIDVEATVSASGTVNGPINLYYATDLSLDGEDDGPGFTEVFGGNNLWGQYSATPAPGAFSGILENSDSPVTSYFLGFYNCAWQPYEDDGDYPGCTTGGPGGNTVNYGEPSTAFTDVGAGAHWELAATNAAQTVNFRLVYATYEDFLAYDWVNLTSAAAEDVQCELLPDMAVSPQYISFDAAGKAQIEVALRNLCNDKPFNYGDVLLSLSDGLAVDGVPAGWLNLGQRAAWQNLSLAPDETKRAVITVSAPNGVPANPQHITELYYKGGVKKRIDGVFMPAAPAAAAAVVTAAPVVIVPAVPAEPAALPVALPNTGGPLLPLGLLTAAGAALVGAGMVRLRRR